MAMPINGRMTQQTAPMEPHKMVTKKIVDTIERVDSAKVFFMAFIRLRLVGSAQTAESPFSSVRMRTACSMFETKILPSPILPVLADLMIALTAASDWL